VRKGARVSDDDIGGFSGNKGRGGLKKHKLQSLERAERQTLEKVEALILSSAAEVLSTEVSASVKI
jgi:hypothetical protein